MNMNSDATEFGSIMHRNLHRKKVGLGPLRLLSFLGITMGVLILLAMAAPSARAAQLLTYYDFENDSGSPTSDGGTQSTSINGVGFFGTQDFGSGTNVNAVGADSTNFAFFTEPFPGLPATSVTLGGLTTTGVTNVSLSFALKSEGTLAYTTLQLFYSTTGVNGPYSPFATLTNLTSYATYPGPPTPFTFDVSTLSGGLVDNVSGSNLFFEFSFSGASSTGSSNATDIDNIQITAVATPEPSTYIGGLFGLVGLCWFERRRFMRLLSSRSA